MKEKSAKEWNIYTCEGRLLELRDVVEVDAPNFGAVRRRVPARSSCSAPHFRSTAHSRAAAHSAIVRAVLVLAQTGRPNPRGARGRHRTQAAHGL